jgi:hypothetical protein
MERDVGKGCRSSGSTSSNHSLHIGGLPFMGKVGLLSSSKTIVSIWGSNMAYPS